MAKKELILQGSYKGVSKARPMKKFDIIHSTIECVGKACYQPKKMMTHLINKLTIRKNESPEGTYSIYHMYDSINKDGKVDYSGRWYHHAFSFNTKSMDPKKKCIHTQMKFQDEATFKEYRVKISVYLSDDGWEKIQSFIS